MGEENFSSPLITTMKLTDIEKIDLQNLMKIIRRAKFDDFGGTEALALSRAYYLLENLLKRAAEVDKPKPVEMPKVIEEQPKIHLETSKEEKKTKKKK